MEIYKVKTSRILGDSIYFIFPLVLTIITLGEGDAVTRGEWIGLSGFWLIGILVLVFLSGAKMEVGEDYVRPYFFGFPRKRIESSQVEVLEYGNLFRGGLGVGKGLKMWVKTPNGRKALTIGEKAYGKDAIEHMKHVLESKSAN